MKKALLTAALLTAVGVAAVVPQAQAAAPISSGTINFTGTLTASSCSVAINGTASATTTITLPNTPLVNGVLGSSGTSAGWTPVTLTLTGCTGLTGYTKVFPYFSGTGIDTTTGYLTNTGSATNVEVALSNTSSLTNVLTLQGASGAQNAGTQLLSATTPTFSYYAGYVATGAATAGGVTATVQYTLNYQ